METINLTGFELKAQAPLFGPIRRLAALWSKASPEQFLALCGAAIGLGTAGRPPWGTLSDAGQDLIEYGDRVVEHLERHRNVKPITVAEVGPDVARWLFSLLPDYAAAEELAGN
jgi:hypothetical protein